LFSLVVAAEYHGRSAWIATVAAEDAVSPLPWRRRRAIVLNGFTAQNALPVVDAWPTGEIETDTGALRCWSARFRYREASAHHWWRAYWAAQDEAQAYAAWILFLRSADRRAQIWMRNELPSDDGTERYQRKKAQFQLNRSKFATVLKMENELDSHFLNRETVTGLSPWLSAGF
jgi:hypothetical protein